MIKTTLLCESICIATLIFEFYIVHSLSSFTKLEHFGACILVKLYGFTQDKDAISEKIPSQAL